MTERITIADELYKQQPIIYSWPSLTRHYIRVFQANNKLKDDGIIGPLTLAEIWRPVGNEYRAVKLAPYVYSEGVPERERVFIGNCITTPANHNHRLQAVHWQTLCEIVSSNWSTGLSWLTGEDGLTIGFRRYAASKARELLVTFVCTVTMGNFNPWEVPIRYQLDHIRDAPNNGWPINDPYMRLFFLSLVRDERWWVWQVRKALEDWSEILDAYPWTKGRVIALACRAQNSGPGYVKKLSKVDDRAYRQLVDTYTDRGEKKNRMDRVRDIEERIGANEIWR